MIDIEAIEKAYQKATPGEWIADHVSSEGPYKLHSVQPRVCDVFYQTEKGAATADCIALLHNAWPQIRRELEAGRKCADALTLLHDNLFEYNQINKLGGENNQDMRQAREALAQYDRSGT